MLINQTDTSKLQTAAAGFCTTLPEGEGRSMLSYTINIQTAWHQLLQKLPIVNGTSVLDVGCGFGLLALEIAMSNHAQIVGSDINPEFVEGAKQLLNILRRQGDLAPQAQVEFTVDDIMSLSTVESPFDVVVVREVFSYVEQPDLAASNLYRATKPGGTICVEDIDDRLYFTYPPPSPDFKALFEAIGELQAARGGDREVGRKLSVFLQKAGFSISNITVMTEPMHVSADPAKGEREFIINQIATLRQRIIDAKLMSGENFDKHLNAMKNEPPNEEFRMNGRIAVFATRPDK